jgi:adenine phosphoribosyltransferase
VERIRIGRQAAPSTETTMDLERFIRDVPDFPKKGVVFKDITPLLGDSAAMREACDRLAAPFADKGATKVVGIESRGFIFATAVAERLKAGFVPIRKPGKLPADTVSQGYELEYGTDEIEIHADAIAPGEKVLMVDDLLATGGTMAAACDLVSKLGGQIVGVAFVIELCFLHGRDKLAGYDLHTLIRVQ